MTEQKLVIWRPLGDNGLKAKVEEALPPEAERLEMARCAQERREHLMDFPRLAERTRLDYRKIIYQGEPWQDNDFVQEDFAAWLDEMILPALYGALTHGLITKEEFEDVWTRCLESWTELTLEIQAHRAGTWQAAYWGMP